MLTSVAFSIHDTIVVFDRVRENLRVGPRLTFDQVINLSTVQTMTRSLNTSLTVVFVLLSLVIFGGELDPRVRSRAADRHRHRHLQLDLQRQHAAGRLGEGTRLRAVTPPAGRRRVAPRTA